MAPAPKEVVVTGVNIPFFAMVWLIFKWSLAAIPAAIMLWFVGMFLTLTVGSAFAGLMASLVAASAATP